MHVAGIFLFSLVVSAADLTFAADEGAAKTNLDPSEQYILKVVQQLITKHSKERLLQKTKSDIQNLIDDINELELDNVGKIMSKRNFKNVPRETTVKEKQDAWLKREMNFIINELQNSNPKDNESLLERSRKMSKFGKYGDNLSRQTKDDIIRNPELHKFHRYGDEPDKKVPK